MVELYLFNFFLPHKLSSRGPVAQLTLQCINRQTPLQHNYVTCTTKTKQNNVIQVFKQFNDDVNGDGDDYDYDVRKEERRFNLVQNVFTMMMMMMIIIMWVG